MNSGSARDRPAKGAQAVCVFVNDRADRACLEILAALGVKLLALRYAGYNNVDLAAARALGVAVVRVPAYSPHAVAEHAIALLLTLNRRIHRAFNQVRELNFSLSGLVGFDLHGKTIGSSAGEKSDASPRRFSADSGPKCWPTIRSRACGKPATPPQTSKRVA